MIPFLVFLCLVLLVSLSYVAFSLRDAIRERDGYRRLWQDEQIAHDRTEMQLMTFVQRSILREVQMVQGKSKKNSAAIGS